MTITKTAIGNYLRKQANGDVGMYRNGFKDGVAWAQKRLAAPTPPRECKTEAEKTAFAFGWWKALEAQHAPNPGMRPATRDEKIVNPGVYEVPDNVMYRANLAR